MLQTSFSSRKTTCTFCGVGCGVLASKDTRGVITIEGDPDHPVNRGMLCTKGRASMYKTVQDQSQRLTYPQMKWSQNHDLQVVDWDIALERVAKTFKTLIEKFGPESVGFYASGQCFTEEYYLLNKLAKGFLGTNNVDCSARLYSASATTAYTQAFGADIMPVCYDDIEKSDLILISGANPIWSHPVLWKRIEAHLEQNPHVKLVVIDPRHTPTCESAALHLQITPGSDVILCNAIARRIIDKGYHDKKFIEKYTQNFPLLKKEIYKYSLKEAAKACGIYVEDIKQIAALIGSSKAFLTLWSSGINQSSIGVSKNNALINLSILTGNIGKPGAGPFLLTGEANTMGAREVGVSGDVLGLHYQLSNASASKDFAEFWSSPLESINTRKGLTITEMFDALETGHLKALWVIGANPLIDLPNSEQTRKALKKAKFVVFQGASKSSEMLQYANVVLPKQIYFEKEGTITSGERKISYLEAINTPPEGTLSCVEILSRFAQKMNFQGFNYLKYADVFEEYAQLSSRAAFMDISGLSYQRLQHEGSFHWPVPTPSHLGFPRLFLDHKFPTPSTKAQFIVPNDIIPRSEKPNANYPLVLLTGIYKPQTYNQVKASIFNPLLSHSRSAYVQMHPRDAYERGLEDNDLVVVSSARGSNRVRVRITDDIRIGVVFLPIRWGKVKGNNFTRTNILTTSIVDEKSKQPDFKFTAVEVLKYHKPKQKIIIIGAGTAAYRFIQTYRKSNNNDSITVFCKEEYPFYNRELLPEYMSEGYRLEQLQKLREGELEMLNVTLEVGNSIDDIITEEKFIIDHRGNRHNYDIMILATGSKAVLPKEEAGVLTLGRFTIRTRLEADRLKNYLEDSGIEKNKQHIAIVGGGLLGLELAAVLRKTGVLVTIIHRGHRLMERQLDVTASKLLYTNICKRGIKVYFDNEVDTVFETSSHSLDITLKTGHEIKTNAIVYCVGTYPNIELAKKADLETKQGVVVNTHLQTSDPSIFAIGEIAEFNGTLHTITAALEKQADVVANYLLGDRSAVYKGSVPMHILKLNDLDLFSVGRLDIPTDDPAFQEVILKDESKMFYKRCLIHNNHLIGAILMGDKTEFADFKRLIENKIELVGRRETLLRPDPEEKAILGKVVCPCFGVGEGNLIETIKSGFTDFALLCEQTGAGLGCSSCKREVKSILAAQLEDL